MKSHPSYQLIGAIGQGRYATVYRARDLALSREVAIKELNDAAWRDERLLQRFWEEARFLANVEHDNVVQIYGLDQERGWIIMELADSNLAVSLTGGPLPAESVRSVLRQVLDGLDCLHHQGRIHGAIQPANLLVTSSGLVKLSDTTGIAGGPIGDAPAKYLAPEQLDASFGPVGPGVDLYDLGFTALELLAGPGFDFHFPGVETGAAEWRDLHKSAAPLPSAAELVPDVPADIGRVLDRLLQKRVSDRYASAADALRALEELPVADATAPVSPATKTIGAAEAMPALVSPPTVRVPAPRRTRGDDVRARETLQPSMFPVLQTPNDREASSPGLLATTFPTPPVQPPAAKRTPALETVRDTPQYPRWSTRWINQKLANPRLLYPLCGGIAFVTVLLLANLYFNGFGSNPPPPPGPGPTPSTAPVAIVRRPVRITSTPAGASIFIDGQSRPEKTDATINLERGRHRVRVTLDGFEAGKQREIDVPTEGPDLEPVSFSLVRTEHTTPQPTPKPPVRPPATGKLVIRSSPEGALVFVDGAERARTPVEIDLPPGRHKIRLEHPLYQPIDRETEIRSAERSPIDLALVPVRAPGMFAVLVGVHLVEGLPVFRHAPADMAELGRTLLAAGYAKENVTVLAQSGDVNSNDAPTPARIREAIKSLVKDRYPEDTLVVALAGPAIVRPADGTSYFCPPGADISRPATLVSLTEVCQQLAMCPAKTKFMLLDGNRGGPSYPARPAPAKLEEVIPPGVTALLATPNGEPAPVLLDERHSVFWHFVQRGLRGAASGTGTVTIGGLADYVGKEARQYIDKAYKIEQTPRLVATSSTRQARLAEAGADSRLLLEGDALLERKEYEKAAEKLSLVLAKRKEIEAYLRRAEAYYYLDRFPAMIDDCTEVLRIDPGNAAAFDFLGDAHRGKAGKLSTMNLEEIKLAIASYDASVQADPDFAPTFQSRGAARASIGAYDTKKEPAKAKSEYELAVADYCQAVNLAPRPNYKYFLNRARAYKQLERYDRAADDYSAALQTGERLEPAVTFLLYYNRGQIYIQTKDFSRAESDFAKAAAIDPKDPDPHKFRARALDGLGREDEAREERAKEATLRGQLRAKPT
jgi:serine/threonine-protein kinase